MSAAILPMRRDGATPPPQLAIRGLGVVSRGRKGDVRALGGVDLTIREGEFVAVLGPSGCGKSTLLRIVSGLIAPSEGEVTLEGVPVRGPQPSVGIVFQQPTLLPWKTVIDNVLVPIRAQGRPTGPMRDRALELLRLAGLEAFAESYSHELSGGMQQRVGIVRGLIHDPKLLLMDEPFSALDAMTRERMAGELQAIWMETRKAVLFITHSIQEAVMLADRIVVLSERPGRVVEVLEVDLPRPRLADVVASPRFAEITAHLRAFFQVDGPLRGGPRR
jgi:NitT/TauT family transport system ATP-binding protein